MSELFDALLSPRSIAVVGASEDVLKPGGKIVQNLLSKHFAGELYAVNPKSESVQGIRAFASVADVPGTPDLGIVAIPARFVARALADLGEKGTRVVVVLSAGFGEVGPEGKDEEQKLVDIASRYGMLLFGPNCLGVMTGSYAGKFAGILPEMQDIGIDFISGSGATVDFLAEQGTRRGLPFGSFVTVGNSAQTGVEDVVALYDENFDEKSSLIKMLYIESIQNPRKLLHHARNLSEKGCSLVGIKSGTTEAGNRAAASHTGAMASSDTAVQALFDKAGIIRTQSRVEMVDVAGAMVCAPNGLRGRRACIITDAGGPGVMLADELNRQGFSVPALKEETRKRLADVLPPGAGTGNPVDFLPSRTAEQTEKIFEILKSEKDNIDFVVFIVGDSGFRGNEEIYTALARAMDGFGLPVFPSLCSAVSSRAALKGLRDLGKFYFEDEVALGRALGKLVSCPRPTPAVTELAGYDKARLSEVLAGEKGVLSPETTREVLEAAGFKLTGQVELTDKNDLERSCDDIPFPWVMKVMGPLHKSDVGGVRVNVTDLAQAGAIWDEFTAIEGYTGVMIQQMVGGTEAIVGVSHEEGFGHLVMFGLGGIYAEALKDAQFRLAPLSRPEAISMIRSIRALPIIEGVRGEQGMDLGVLEDILVRIALLVTDFPLVKEMDLNPVKGYGTELYAVDSRIILGEDA